MITAWTFQVDEGSAFIQIHLGLSPKAPQPTFNPKVSAVIREAKRRKHLLGVLIPDAREAALFAYDPKDQTNYETQILELFGINAAQVPTLIKNGKGKE